MKAAGCRSTHVVVVEEVRCGNVIAADSAAAAAAELISAGWRTPHGGLVPAQGVAELAAALTRVGIVSSRRG